MNQKKGLGRGLEALISIENDNENEIKEIRINDIEPNINQPRKKFDEEKIKELAESIKKHGVVQPIIVKKENDIYRIIAGERRWRAARAAGLKTIPAIIKDLNEREILEIALIENLQREDLNPIEEAEAYERLIREFGMTQEEISEIVGKSRPAIANSIRLLNLDEKIKKELINGTITSGHARALLMIENPELRISAMQEIIKNGYNVRQAEKLAVKINESVKNKRADENDEKPKDKIENIEKESLEETLRNILGTKVKLDQKKNSGKIIIEYYSQEELTRIIDIFKKMI